LQALRAASLTAAEALGTDDRLEMVEAGKFADMVVQNADSLPKIQNLRKIHLVVQDGKTYALDALLQQARSQANKTP
jgi:imidazolonepropionase-like amidohydrolase